MGNDFKKELNRYTTFIENHLPEYLPKKSPLYHQVVDAMEYSLMAGGKRIRAVLVLHFAELFGLSSEVVMPLAAAIEMIHAYSLIHDDLPCMDNDNMRRGKPSCHIAFGEDTALLAGDGLLTLAFETAVKTQIPTNRLVAVVKELSDKAGVNGMIGGQVIDLACEEKQVDLDTLTTMNLMKTGALIRVSARIGCIAAGAKNEYVEAADNYARNIGLAFQIIDDILDVTSTAEVLGKPIGSDAENHKTTYVSLLGLENAKMKAMHYVKLAHEAASQLQSDDQFLISLADYLMERNY